MPNSGQDSSPLRPDKAVALAELGIGAWGSAVYSLKVTSRPYCYKVNIISFLKLNLVYIWARPIKIIYPIHVTENAKDIKEKV